MATCNIVGYNNKKVINVKVNKIKHYFIGHTKIGLKSPKERDFQDRGKQAARGNLEH